MQPSRRAHTAVAALVACLGALCVPGLANAAAAPRLIVGFDPGTTPAAQVRALGVAGVAPTTARASVKGGVAKLRLAVVPVAQGRLAATARRLRARTDVRFVEVDGLVHAYGWSPNDTYRSQQWALDTVGAPAAWDTARGTGVTIAVLDTGVDHIHPDLAGRVDLGRDYVDSDDDPMDVQGHGTHVAGIAAATADDGYGIAGLAPGARILAIRVLDAEGAGNYSWVAAGIVAAADRGAKVINLSLGAPDGSAALRAAVDYAAAKGSVVTCATGNESASSIGFPARYDSCLAVGASTVQDTRASFSNVGTGIDVVAPGEGILSSTIGGTHDAWDGTSMASPYAAGLAALLVSQGLGRRAVIDAITSTARDLDAPGHDTTTGHGRIDAAAAVLAASRQPRSTAPDTVPPTVSAIEVLPTRRVVRTTFTQRWKRTSTTPFSRVGYTDVVGTHTWRRTSVRGNVRTVVTFRARRGVVSRSTSRYVRTKVARRTTTAFTPLRVTAADDRDVDRVAIVIDGTVRGVDESGADGWTIEVPCTPGARRIEAWAFDAADGQGTGRLDATLAC